jgi:glycosyltransferase involved in cell wall biosynthesis
LFLGALNRKKGPDIFLRAAILLAPELPGWTFVLVGPETSEDAAWQTTLKELAVHPSLSGRVEWLGRLKPSAVVEEILRARLVVCPSRIETFSRTTVEALALGRPVIVSETTGAASWVKTTDCGSVVAENDPTALADAMREWTSRDDAPNGSEKVTSQLTASLAADDWIREVRAAIQGHASGTNKLS